MAVSGDWQRPHDCPAGDPYLRWQQFEGWRGLLPSPDEPAQDWLPLLIKRRGKTGWPTLCKQLPELRLSADADERMRVASAWLPAARLAVLEPLVAGVELSLPSRAGRAPGEPGHWPALPSLHGKPVVVGVIDRGGAPLHAAFRDPDQPERSRLLAFWDQTSEPSGPWQTAPAGYGRLLAGAALQGQMVHGAAAERQAYAELGLHELLALARDGEADHATHVLDALAGLPDGRAAAAAAKPLQRDAACEAPLVLVSVPAPAAGQSGAAAAMAQVLDALNFIRSVARRAAPDAAVVVNLSMGLQAGPCNGSLLLEQAIDELMEQDPGLLVVMAAGNAAAQPQAVVGYLHGNGELGWRIRPLDGTDSHLELAWQGGAKADLALQLLPPFGAPASPWLRPGQQAGLHDAAGRPIGLLQLTPEGRGLISLAPALEQRHRGHCSPGCWRLGLRSSGGVLFSARLQGDPWRDEQRSSPQSYLEYARGLQLQRGGLRNAIASGRFPLVVGAARLREAVAAPYTPALSEPDMHWLAAADESAFAPGLIGAGPLSGQWARMSGSSVAAPVAARHWVNLIARDGVPGWAGGWRQWGQPARRTGARVGAQAGGETPRRQVLKPGPLGLRAVGSSQMS